MDLETLYVTKGLKHRVIGEVGYVGEDRHWVIKESHHVAVMDMHNSGDFPKSPWNSEGIIRRSRLRWEEGLANKRKRDSINIIGDGSI